LVRRFARHKHQRDANAAGQGPPYVMLLPKAIDEWDHALCSLTPKPA
jgi:hypothetical protein